MSPLKSSLLIAILACVSACGRQVVEFKLGEDAGTDGNIDARPDGSTDAPTDGPLAVRPVVTTTTPSPGAINVALTTLVTATFSKPMNAGTLTMTTFTLRQGSTVLTGAVGMNTAGTIATLTPSASLTAGLVYTATVTTGAMDTGGLTLVANHTWMFTAGTGTPVAPTVTSTTPIPNATNVTLSVSPTALFSQTMNGATITMATFTLAQGVTPIAGAVMLDGAGTTATFNPTVDLTAGLVYTATITTGAQGTNGLFLAANYTWMFTAATAAVLPPMVVSTTPALNATNVALNVSPTALFDQTMNGATINNATFTLAQGATPIVGVVTLDGLGTTATFNPTLDLTVGLVYTATITTGAQGTNAMALAANYTWMFTAGAIAVPPTVTSTTPGPNAMNVALNVSPTAQFSQTMTSATINMLTFTLAQGATPIVGTVTLNGAGTLATFDPTVDLTAGLVYTATITTGAQGTNGLFLAANHTWMFTAGTVAAQPPMVISTTPGPNAMNVALNVSPTALFDQTMNGLTINTTTFTLTQGVTPIVGVVMLDGLGTTATFDPAVDLTAGLVYTATITTGAQGTNAMALAANYTWMFTAGTPLAPMVMATTPTPNALNVPLNVSPTATFDQPMTAATINMLTFTLAQGLTPVVGTVTYDTLTNTATFNPTLDLTAGLVYTATITTGAQGTNGMFLATNYTWMFTTGAALPPTVTMTTPSPNAMLVSITVSPTATFSQPMDMTTIDTTTFTLAQGATPIGGLVTYNALTNTATFNPTVDLTTGLIYTATITTGAEDINGLPLAAPHTWNFTTGTTLACVVPPVVLGPALTDYAILAASTVTNTGPTLITGDLGVWPLAAVTGFPPGILIGTLYAGVTPAMTAQGNLTVAYDDAQGRTLCLVSIVGDLGGLTLPPGLYKSTSFLEITTGDLVLDAMGDPNAVWIFSMASELTVANNRLVTIIGGGSAANVYWAVGSSAVIGTGVSMVGTIMADQAISFGTGSVLLGRALARIAAVTLDSTTVTKP